MAVVNTPDWFNKGRFNQGDNMRYEYNTLEAADATMNKLNEFGAQHWRLVLQFDNTLVFIREIPEVGVKVVEPQVRATA